MNTEWRKLDELKPDQSGYFLCWVPKLGRPIMGWYCKNKGWFETSRAITYWAPYTNAPNHNEPQ